MLLRRGAHHLQSYRLGPTDHQIGKVGMVLGSYLRHGEVGMCLKYSGSVSRAPHGNRVGPGKFCLVPRISQLRIKYSSSLHLPEAEEGDSIISHCV